MVAAGTYLEQGCSKSGFAERIGMNRWPVYRWIAIGETDRDLDDEKARHSNRPAVKRKIGRGRPWPLSESTSV